MFVEAANLGREELDRYGSFPLLDKLDPLGDHRAVMRRIDRAIAERFREISLPEGVPLLFLPGWNTYGRTIWRQLHAYWLVRRAFDSLCFLTRASRPNKGAQFTQLMLHVRPADDGSVVRVHDPYEDFLAELNACDLRRLRACPACRRFFIAWRLDQKACSRRCANQVRVWKFRKKQPEYLGSRKFRRQTGLRAVRKGKRQLVELHEALTGESSEHESD